MTRRTAVPGAVSSRRRCLAVARLAAEASGLSVNDVLNPRLGPRRASSARALAMYLAHVALGETMTGVARDFHRHRSTVAHACRRVENRRDEAACDRWIAGLERRIQHEMEVRDAG